MKKKAIFFSMVLACVSGCGGSSGDPVYVAIGASDATGVGASPITNGYVYRINDGVDKSCGGVELNNLGIPGVQSDQIENAEVPLAVELDPSLITVFVGGNDIIHARTTESFEDNVEKILSKLREKTSASIFIANLPDLTQLPRFIEEPDADVTAARVAAFNSIIARQARAFNVTVIDLFAEDVRDVLVSDDGFHPNDAGHAVVAELFLKQIIPQYCGKTYP